MRTLFKGNIVSGTKKKKKLLRGQVVYLQNNFFLSPSALLSKELL